MNTTIYFVRHGEVYNPKEVWYGRLPGYGLSEKGKAQIAQTAAFLAGQHIDVVYTSPLLLARQTAKIISDKLHLPAHTSKELLEVQSSLQGTPFATVKTFDYDIFAAPGRDVVGETIEEVASRQRNFINKMFRLYPGKRIVAVSHGDPIMLVSAISKQLPIKNISLRPGADAYIKHGEVYRVEHIEGKQLRCTSIFTPSSR
jgi:broad specificity phosphatase PhoE